MSECGTHRAPVDAGAWDSANSNSAITLIDVSIVIGSLVWLLHAGFTGVLALNLTKRLDLDSHGANAAVFVLTWTIVVSLNVLLFGLVGWLRPLPFGLLSLAGIGAMLAIGRRRVFAELVADYKAVTQVVATGWRSLPSWMRVVSIVFIVGGLVRFALLSWLLPPFVWDSLTYHLTNVAHWVQAGRIELFNSPMTRIYTAANYELLATWVTVFLHNDLWIETAGLPAYALALLSIYAIVRTQGASRSGGLLAAFSYGTMPGFLFATTGTKNDPHMASYFLAAMLFILILVRRRSSLRTRANALVVLTLSVMLALGTKAYIIHLLPGLAVAGLLLLMGAHGWRKLRHWLVDTVRAIVALFESNKWQLIGLLAAGVLLAGYWNVRNWVLTGNPFYPYGVAVEGQQVLTGAGRNALLTVDRLVDNMRLLGERFGDKLEPIRPDLPFVTGWGWFTYGVGLLATAWASLRRRRFAILALGFFISFLTLQLSTRPSPWNLRYAIWLPAIFSLGYAFWHDHTLRISRELQLAFTGLAVVLMGLNLAMSMNYNRVEPRQFAYMLETTPLSRNAAKLRLTVPAEYENALVYVPEDVVLGYNTHSNGFIYPLYGSDFSREIVYIPFESTESCEQIAGKMSAAGVRHLLVAPEHSSDQNILRLRQCATQADWIRERARGLYVLANE